MPNPLLHLAVAKRYLEKNPGSIKDPQSFYDGNIMPDLANDREQSHYGDRSEVIDPIKRFRNKVCIAKFLSKNKTDTDLNKGILFHLYVDWEYYNDFLDKEYLSSVNFDEYTRDHVYTIIQYVDFAKGYGISHATTSFANGLDKQWREYEIADELRWGKNFRGKLLYTREQITEFIERMASTNLADLITRYKPQKTS